MRKKDKERNNSMNSINSALEISDSEANSVAGGNIIPHPEEQYFEVVGFGRGNRNGPEMTKIRWGGTTGLTMEDALAKAVKKDQSYWSQ